MTCIFSFHSTRLWENKRAITTFIPDLKDLLKGWDKQLGGRYGGSNAGCLE